MNHSFVIANYIIKKFNGKINLMKLQSLIYYAQGWNLLINEEAIIKEFIRLDNYGIRIDSLYYSLISDFGNNDLILDNNKTNKMLNDLSNDLELNIDYGNIFNDYVKLTIPRSEITFIKPENLKVIDKVIESYGIYSANKLFNMLHVKPHPFAKFNGKYETIEETYINNEELKYCFKLIDKTYSENKNI